MNMFDDISSGKKDLPKLGNVVSDVSSYNYNFYERSAVVIGIIFFVLGIILGNIFPACGSSSSIYSTQCSDTVFNFSLTLIVWFSSFILCIFIFGLGQIIALLNRIYKKIDKI